MNNAPANKRRHSVHHRQIKQSCCLQNKLIRQQRPFFSYEIWQHPQRFVPRTSQRNLVSSTGKHYGNQHSLQNVEPQQGSSGQEKWPAYDGKTPQRILLEQIVR
jgi:hypothetical protein